MGASIGDKIFSGAMWSLVERLSTQFVQGLLGIILARLLTPGDYGLIGLLMVFIVFSQVFIESGFTKALIQKKETSQEDISTVFFFNIAISILCYVILWLCAPLVATFYEINQLKILLRVLSISLILNALFTVPTTIVTISLNFKLLAKINFIAVFLSGSVAIYLAYSGYGVWSLVYQTLIKSILTVLLMWFWIKWKPSFIFSISSFKNLFGFGSKLLMGSLLNSAASNISSLLIGKIISPKQLGFYTQGIQYPDLLLKTINTVINKVLLPTLSNVQDQKETLILYTKKIIKTATIFIAPIFFILILIAEPFIKTVLGDKWITAVPIIQIFALARFITILSSININLLHVLGRSDLSLKQEYIKIPIRVILILIAIKFGIIYVALAELLATLIHFFINTYYPGKLTNYGAFIQIKDISTFILINISLLLICFIVMNYINIELLKLLISPILFLSLYALIIFYYKSPEAILALKKGKKMISNVKRNKQKKLK